MPRTCESCKFRIKLEQSANNSPEPLSCNGGVVIVWPRNEKDSKADFFEYGEEGIIQVYRFQRVWGNCPVYKEHENPISNNSSVEMDTSTL